MEWTKERIIELRETLGLTQAELAERLGANEAEIVAELERGVYPPSPQKAMILDRLERQTRPHG
jgi:transcriptional regulator with XRE-family HTH domain